MATTYDPPGPLDPTGPQTPVIEPELQPAVQEQTQPSAPFAPPPAKRRGRRTLAIVSAALVFFLLLLGGGAALANASLSSTYSAGRAVSDYFGAQSRGDVAYMEANANYPKSDSGSDSFFGSDSLTAMVNLSENRAIANVKITGVQQLDSTTSKVNVSLTWAGTPRSLTYVAHKDPSRTHYVFYNSWRIDIPSSTITVQLPPQPGGVGVDGVYVQSAGSVSVIQGYHTVSMHASDFYDSTSDVVDATGDQASVDFSSTQLSASTVAAAANEIRSAFEPNSIQCDAKTYFDCPNHKYTPAPGTYAVLELPGGNVSAYRTWMFTISGDPTTGMKLVVTDTKGVITASGTCAMQLLVDGSKKYSYHGTWKGTLTWSNGGFAYEGSLSCDDVRG